MRRGLDDLLTRGGRARTLRDVNRGITLAVPGLALATMGGLWAELHRAVHAPLPHFGDHDASGRYGTPGARPLRVQVLGDSSLTGPGLSRGSQIWIAQLVDGLPWDVELTSRARGGSRVADLLVHQAPLATRARPDLFVVAVGANDTIHLTPARQFEQQLDQLVSRLCAVAPVVTLGIGDLSTIPRVPRSFRSALARRCETMDRIHAAVTGDRHGVTRVPVAELSDAHFRAGGLELFADDQFHPNLRGHTLWAELFRHFVHDAVVAQLDAAAPADR